LCIPSWLSCSFRSSPCRFPAETSPRGEQCRAPRRRSPHGSIGCGWQPHRSQPAARRAFRINICQARALPTQAISLERGDTAPGGGLHRVRAEQTRLGSNGIWERDIEGSWAGGRCRISPAAGTLGLNWVQIHHLLPLTPWRRQQSLCERALKIIPAQDAPGMLPSTSLVLPAAPGAPRRCSPWLTSIQLVIKSARRHLPFRSPFPSLPMVLLSSRTISLGWDRVAAFPLSLLARAGWEPTTPDGNPSPRRVPGNATTGAQGRQERGRLISALPSPSLSFILGVV